MVVVVLLLLVTVIILLFSPGLKVDCIESARLALVSARQQRADLYAPKQFNDADSVWNKLLECWHQQNERFFLVRNYGHITDLAIAPML